MDSSSRKTEFFQPDDASDRSGHPIRPLTIQFCLNAKAENSSKNNKQSAGVVQKLSFLPGLKRKFLEFQAQSVFCGCNRGQKIHFVSRALHAHFQLIGSSKTRLAQGDYPIWELRGVLKFCRSIAGQRQIVMIDECVSSLVVVQRVIDLG